MMATKTKDLSLTAYRDALRSMDIEALQSELRAIDGRRAAIGREMRSTADASTLLYARLEEVAEDLARRHDMIGDEVSDRPRLAPAPHGPDLVAATKLGETPYRGAEFRTDLFASWRSLYRSAGGKFFEFLHGGGGIAAGFQHYLTREEAIDWLVEEDANHPTREQATAIVDGE